MGFALISLGFETLGQLVWHLLNHRGNFKVICVCAVVIVPYFSSCVLTSAFSNSSSLQSSQFFVFYCIISSCINSIFYAIEAYQISLAVCFLCSHFSSCHGIWRTLWPSQADKTPVSVVGSLSPILGLKDAGDEVRHTT